MPAPLSERLVPVPADRLQLGMFVAELDRPWLETPFSSQGFRLTHDQQLEDLQRCCAYVYVDPARSELSEEEFFASGLTVRLQSLDPANLESRQARLALRDLAHALATSLKLARRHEALPLARLRDALKPLLTALASDPDTVLWLMATEFKAGLFHRRALHAAAHMALYARRLDFNGELTAELCLAALVLDVGKITIPVPILAKPGRLNARERRFVERHVARGLLLIRGGTLVSRPMAEFLGGHHERLDGSGYPLGTRGTQIPLLARLAAIVDTFGALTEDRHYASARAPHEALRQIYQLRRRHYDSALFRDFVWAVGVYPTGSWIRLADGRLGIVRSQVPDEPKAPRIRLVADALGQPLAGAEELWSPRRRGEIAGTPAPAEVRIEAHALNAVLGTTGIAA